LLVRTRAAATVPCTLSLHDALPISGNLEAGAAVEPYGTRHVAVAVGDEARHAALDRDGVEAVGVHLQPHAPRARGQDGGVADHVDRKSTRLNSSHVKISYAVFCLKK